MGVRARFVPQLTPGEEERRRLLAADDLRAGMSQAEVARKYGVSRVSVHRWDATLEHEGKRGLRAKKHPGGKAALSDEQLKEVPRILKRGAQSYGFATDLWTTPRLREVFRRQFGVDLHRSNVHRTLVRLGFTWQRPERRARERDERAIQKWIANEWPALQKRGRN